jgi:hypothetical protein
MGIRDAGPIRSFREFRWTRPFWGGLFVGAGGLVIGVLPVGPTNDLLHVGYGLFASEVCALLLLAMAGLILFFPSQRMLAAVVAVLISLASFPLSNLGGFVVGMMAGIIGGCLAFGWVPDKKHYRRPVAPPDDGPRRPRPSGAGRDPNAGPAATEATDPAAAVQQSIFVGGRS